MIDNEYDVQSAESECGSADAGVALVARPVLPGASDSPHRYRAFRSNPVVNVDPLGLQATQPTTQPSIPILARPTKDPVKVPQGGSEIIPIYAFEDDGTGKPKVDDNGNMVRANAKLQFDVISKGGKCRVGWRLWRPNRDSPPKDWRPMDKDHAGTVGGRGPQLVVTGEDQGDIVIGVGPVGVEEPTLVIPVTVGPPDPNWRPNEPYNPGSK